MEYCVLDQTWRVFLHRESLSLGPPMDDLSTLLHFDPKSDGAWISLFKLTKNHKDTFFFVNVATSVAEATAILITVG